MSGEPKPEHGSTGGSGETQVSALSKQLDFTKKKKVMINWFSEGDSGTKFCYELEITETNLVSDVIGFSTQHFSEKTGTILQSEEFVLRPAKKDGKPKTEYPILDGAQAVYSSGFVSFTLCPASLKAKDAWVPANLSESESSPKLDTKSLPKAEPKPAPKPDGKIPGTGKAGSHTSESSRGSRGFIDVSPDCEYT